jgi:hypothetical protein
MLEARAVFLSTTYSPARQQAQCDRITSQPGPFPHSLPFFFRNAQNLHKTVCMSRDAYIYAIFCKKIKVGQLPYLAQRGASPLLLVTEKHMLSMESTEH